jgi:hypothetical protein
MLECRDDARLLEPLHIRGGNRADEVGVFANGLFDAAPAGVAYDIEHRRKALVHADRAHVGADPPGHLAHERRVERRTPGQRNRVGGGSPGGKAGETLFVG